MSQKPAPDLTVLMLVNEYGNAVFDCGRWDDDPGRTYEEVYARAESARTALIAALETRQELLEACRAISKWQTESPSDALVLVNAAIQKAEAAK